MKGFGLFAHLQYVLADLSGLNYQSQTPFPHRALQLNHTNYPLPVLVLKVHDMKERFSVEMEGRAE